MEELTDQEIIRRNRLIAQSEALIRARGQHADGCCRYESPPFKVVYRGDGTGSRLLVAHYDRVVMRVQWEAPGDPGRGTLTDGAWQRDFLALPVAHA